MGTLYKLEQHLNDICKENQEYGDLLATWNINKKSYTEALRPITQNYPHYTEHGAAHSEAIIANIELLLGEDKIKKLSPTDTWLILQAAYLHDIGMSLMYDRIEKEWETEEFQEYLTELLKSSDSFLQEAAIYLLELKEKLKAADFEKNWPLKVRSYVTVIIADYYRQYHGEISKGYINDLKNNWGISLDFNGLIQERLIILLGNIAYIHTQSVDEVKKLDYMSNGHNTDYIHPRFVAEMIRMGDLLDADNNRCNPFLYKTLTKMPDSSEKHIKKHNAARHILITPDLIEFRADCESNEVYRETRNFMTCLIREMDFLTKEWAELVPKEFSGHAPRLGKTEVLLQGSPDLNGVTDLRFEISQEKAFDVIEGSNLYEDPLVFIREVIQNAMDACKIQLWRDLKDGKYDAWIDGEVNKSLNPFEIDSKIYDNYKVSVRMTNIDNKWVEVVVSDNGTGISVETLKQICNVGNSYWGRKQLKREIQQMPLWLKPTAGFGIGLQSIFPVTDSFDIISKCKNETIKASFESRKSNGYVQVSKYEEKRRQGTDVIVKIPIDMNFKFSYMGNTFEYFSKRYDYFGDKNLSLQYKLLDVMLMNCKEFYFPIEIQIEGEKVEDIEGLKREFKKEEWQSEGIYYYRFSEEKTSMEMWDIEHCVYLNWSLGRIDYRGEDIHFRGIETGKNQIGSRKGVHVLVDIYGLETKESLTLDRKKLTGKAVEKVEAICDQAWEFYKSKLLSSFIHMDDEEFQTGWGGENYEERLLSFWSILNASERDDVISRFRNRFEKVEYTVEVFSLDRNQKEVTLEEKSFVEVAENLEKMAYFNYPALVSEYDEKQKEKSLEAIRYFLKLHIDEIQTDYVLADKVMFECMREYGVDSIFVIPEPKLIILFYMDKNYQNENYCIRTNEKEKQFLLKCLTEHEKNHSQYGWYRKSARRLIPAMEEYKELAVKQIPGGISGMYFYRTASLISPILLEDKKKIGSLGKEEYIESICSRNDFRRLVEFVYQNQIEPDCYSRETIRVQYQKLIGEYYDDTRVK